jgi:hypothetical protein
VRRSSPRKRPTLQAKAAGVNTPISGDVDGNGQMDFNFS